MNTAAAHFVLALGGLFLGTAEFAAMGLLPSIAETYGVDMPTAGHLVSLYAIGVVVGAPLLTVVTARMEKRKLLMGLALLIVVGNAGSALAQSFGMAGVARFVSGLPHGAYYGTAGLVAASLVAPQKRTQAIGHVMLGLAAANVAGVPLVTWMGQVFGWRSAFALVAAGGALLFVLLPLVVSRRHADEGASPLSELSAFGSLQIWLTLATAAIGFGGMFAVYSYITPTLTEITGIAEAYVPWMLALWGLGMVAGNTFGGWLADKALTCSIVGFFAWTVATLALFGAVASSVWLAGAALFLVGIGFALVPALQARLMDAAPRAQSLASAMNHSAFNFSNAIGAWTGGLAISAGFGWASTGFVGAALALAGLVIFAGALMLQRKD
ncbi:MFS transporter [Acuticoccus sediminis]|uniref:MFS transporter n=1 Tax=Acuticoccus sediminis TaxID=2184697 RepID=UPI001CFDE923|nr:MFS transporter [Acuticoccus sediminis]